MQKFTVFTIIFSVIIITIVAELVVQDYLEKVYPPASSLQASATQDDEFEFFYPDQELPEEEEAESDEEEESDTSNKVLEILEENRSEIPEEGKETEEETPRESAPEELSTNISARVQTLLPALSIPNVEYKPGTFNGRLFNLVTTEDLAIKEATYGFFEVDADIIGSFYEFETKNTLIAESTYEKLIEKFDEFPEIEINQTNQFGDQSFYINHSVKVNEVFVVIQKDNYVYSFAYQNQFHEVFKAFFGVLL